MKEVWREEREKWGKTGESKRKSRFVNLKGRVDIIYLEQVNQIVREARRLTLVTLANFSHNCPRVYEEYREYPVETRRPRVCRRREKKTSENCLICGTMPGLTDASELRIKFSWISISFVFLDVPRRLKKAPPGWWPREERARANLPNNSNINFINFRFSKRRVEFSFVLR